MTIILRSAIALLLCLAASLAAHAQMDLITTHRQWVADRYADPSRFTEQRLLDECIDIISNYLQEPQCLDILAATSKYVPALDDYIDYMKHQQPDTLCRHTLGALEAVARYSEDSFPGSVLAAKAISLHLMSVASIYDYDSRIDQQIKKWEKIVNKDSSRELRAQLLIMKMINFMQRNSKLQYDDANKYGEIFDFEREALDIYPADSDAATYQRAELYNCLAELKNFITIDFIGSLFQADADFNLDTEFMLTGGGRHFPSNAGWYYARARELAETIYSPGHPYVRSIVAASLRLESRNKYLSDDLSERLKHEFDYTRYYFPRESSEVAAARINWVGTCVGNGRTTSEELFLGSSADVLETSYGISNPYYFQYLQQVAMSKIMTDPDDDRWIERLKSAMASAGYAPDSEEVTISLVPIYTFLHYADPQMALEKLEPVYEWCRKTKSRTPLARQIECTLGLYYKYSVFNDVRGNEMLLKVIEGMGKPFSPELMNNLNFWNISSIYNQDKIKVAARKEELRRQIDWVRKSDLPGKGVLRYYLAFELSNLVKDADKNYSEASRILQECLPDIPHHMYDVRLKCLNSINFLSYLAKQTDGDFESRLASAEEICREAPQGELEYTTLQILGQTYSNIFQFDKALHWYKAAAASFAHMWGEGAYTPDYVLLNKDMAFAYESMGNLTEAYRLISENADFLSASFGVTPDPLLLDNMWLEYHALRRQDDSDLITLMAKLQQILDLTNRLALTSEKNVDLLESYGIRLAAEMIKIMSLNIDMDEVAGWPEEMRTQMDLWMSQLKEYVKMLQGLLDDIKDRQPDYAENIDYRTGLSALATYYANIEHDIPATLEWAKQLLGDSINEDNAINYSDYIRLLFIDGRLEEADLMADRLEAAMKHFRKDTPWERSFIEDYRIGQHLRNGEPHKALPYARANFARQKEVLDGNFRLMTKQEQENYMTVHGDPSNLLVGLLQFLPDELGEECYDAVIYRTGMQLRSQRAFMDAVTRAGNPELRQMLDSIGSLRAIIDRGIPQDPNRTPEESQASLVQQAELKHRANRMEQQVLAAVEKYTDKDVADVTWTQIRDRLRADEAAVEFVFSNTDVLALVLRPGFDTPQVVDLCNADSLVIHLRSDAGRNSASRARSLYTPGDTTLYSMLWHRLEPAVEGTRRIYYSLPGILSTLAFNAFATPEGSTLFDRHELVQLTTTGQLVFDHPESTPSSIAMMGDILYHPDQQPLAADAAGLRAMEDDFDFEDADADGARAVSRTHFRHLPFTALEIRDITGEFSSGTGKARVDTLTRLAATETELRRLASESPDVLHLATHGYYISGDADINRYPFLKIKGSGTMQRSGVALAGAEDAWRGISTESDDNDGILTASEVASLDLSRTGLVALSACETALGDYSFEGIFGLQRGFKQAGVQSLLVSLWSVNDRSTSLFMQEFYRSLRGGSTRYDSWRRAVERVRADYPEPYYWAPFILLD